MALPFHPARYICEALLNDKLQANHVALLRPINTLCTMALPSPMKALRADLQKGLTEPNAKRFKPNPQDKLSKEDASETKANRPRQTPYVIVLGDTGAGKSSMLNALLGEQQIVPTNGMRACTAAIIELRANTAEQPGYSGEVEFVSREAWAKDEAELWKQLTNEDGSLMLECPKEGTPAHEAWWRVKSIYGRVAAPEVLRAIPNRPKTTQEVADWLQQQLPEPWGQQARHNAVQEDVDWEALLTMSEAEVEEVLGVKDAGARQQLAAAARAIAGRTPAESVTAVIGQTIKLTAASAAQLHTAVKPYVDSANQGSTGALWPLVQRVVLRGPWESHIGSSVLVDAPGVQDENSSRGEMVRRYLTNADSVLLVSNIRRAVNDKSVKDMMPPPLRQLLVDKGRPGALAFVATQSDVLVRSEIAENLGLPRKSTTERCALERNAYTCRRLIMDFYLSIDTSRNPAAAAQHAKFKAQTGPQYKHLHVFGPGFTPASTGSEPSNPNVINLVDDSDDDQPGTSLAVTGRPGMRSFPDPRKVKEAAEAGTPLAKVLDDVDHMLTTQEGSLRKGSITGRASRATSRAVEAVRQAYKGVRESLFTFPVFAISAVEAQKWEGVRTSDGSRDSCVFKSLDDTQIPALRAHVRGLSTDHNAAVLRHLHAAANTLEESVGKLESVPEINLRGTRQEQALGVVRGSMACVEALVSRLERERGVQRDGGAGSSGSSSSSKPGKWMLEAVDAVRAAQAAEDVPP